MAVVHPPEKEGDKKCRLVKRENKDSYEKGI